MGGTQSADKHGRVDADPAGTGHMGSLPWLRPLPPDRKLWATRIPSPGWAVTTLVSQLAFLTLRILVLLPWPWASRVFSGFGHLSTMTGRRMSMSAHSSSQDWVITSQAQNPSPLQVSLSAVTPSFLSHNSGLCQRPGTRLRVTWLTKHCQHLRVTQQSLTHISFPADITWLTAGLYFKPGLFKIFSTWRWLKLETPIAFTSPSSTSSSMA